MECRNAEGKKIIKKNCSLFCTSSTSATTTNGDHYFIIKKKNLNKIT